ncbi:MAG TPA: hypothetical protein VE569_06970, partial [Acidimicrobiia bacterium]|nr:hypothetical protein [Acidimicrobiia bacterium]
MPDQERPEKNDGADSVTDELPFSSEVDETPGSDTADDDVDTNTNSVNEKALEVDDGGPDWEAMARGQDVEEFTSEEYLKGTTEEYRGLAEEVERASAA